MNRVEKQQFLAEQLQIQKQRRHAERQFTCSASVCVHKLRRVAGRSCLFINAGSSCPDVHVTEAYP